MRVYISGKITGNPNYEKDFEEVEKELAEKGFEVINPVKVASKCMYLEYKEHLKIDLQLLEKAEAMYQMDGWEESKGARLEKAWADCLGIPVYSNQNAVDNDKPFGFKNKIYGYSDDNVCIEGEDDDEIGCFDSTVKLFFDDGTEIEVRYGKYYPDTKENKGIWEIRIIKEGFAPHRLMVCDDENAEIYSDIFETDARVKDVEVLS